MPTPKNTFKTVATWLILLALIGGGGGFAYTRYAAKAKEPPVRFETAKVDRGPIVAKITASGTLSALVTVQVGSQVSGRIRELFVDFNSPVKKGEILARIDPQLFEAALEQARANHLAAAADVKSAEASALNAQQQLARTEALLQRKLVAPSDYDAARASADVARAQVDSAKGHLAQQTAALHQASINLAYTTIRSPIDGIVVSRNVDVGQTVAASLQAPVLFVLAEDLRRMQVDTNVAEADIGKLTPGMTARFRVDAYPSREFVGKVRQIRNAPQVVQNVVTYDAVIDVQNPELQLKPGMTANVSFVYAEKADVLRLPNAALRFRLLPEVLARLPGASKAAPERSESREVRTVWVVEGDSARPVVIRTGVSDGVLTEVVEGKLAPGDAIARDASVTGGSRSSTGSGMGPSGGLRRVF